MASALDILKKELQVKLRKFWEKKPTSNFEQFDFEWIVIGNTSNADIKGINCDYTEADFPLSLSNVVVVMKAGNYGNPSELTLSGDCVFFQDPNATFDTLKLQTGNYGIPHLSCNTLDCPGVPIEIYNSEANISGSIVGSGTLNFRDSKVSIPVSVSPSTYCKNCHVDVPANTSVFSFVFRNCFIDGVGKITSSSRISLESCTCFNELDATNTLEIYNSLIGNSLTSITSLDMSNSEMLAGTINITGGIEIKNSNISALVTGAGLILRNSHFEALITSTMDSVVTNSYLSEYTQTQGSLKVYDSTIASFQGSTLSELESHNSILMLRSGDIIQVTNGNVVLRHSNLSKMPAGAKIQCTNSTTDISDSDVYKYETSISISNIENSKIDDLTINGTTITSLVNSHIGSCLGANLASISAVYNSFVDFTSTASLIRFGTSSPSCKNNYFIFRQDAGLSFSNFSTCEIEIPTDMAVRTMTLGDGTPANDFNNCNLKIYANAFSGAKYLILGDSPNGPAFANNYIELMFGTDVDFSLSGGLSNIIRQIGSFAGIKGGPNNYKIINDTY